MMPTNPAEQTGRSTLLQTECSGCGKVWEFRTRLPRDRDESDQRVDEFLSANGWSGQFGIQGGNLTCHRCNGHPPKRRKLWAVDPENPKTWARK